MSMGYGTGQIVGYRDAKGHVESTRMSDVGLGRDGHLNSKGR